MIPGTSKKVGKYTMTDQLGKGKFGIVFKGFSRDDPSKLYAIKSLEKKTIISDELLSKLFYAEVSIMQKIKHPNIMPLYDFIETANNYYLVMKLCSDGDFSQYIKKRGIKFFTEEEAVDFLKQIMNGFQELYNNHAMHRDFKLENIFVDVGPTIIIGDFGFAKSGCELTGTVLGTPLTMAPEIIEQKLGLVKEEYTSKVDLWSIGAVFYKLLFGNYPFIAENISGLFGAIKAGSGQNLKIDRQINKISPEAEDLLRKLLTYDSKARIEWVEFFKHKLFDKHVKTEGDYLMANFVGELGKQNVDHENLFQANQKKVDCCKGPEFTNPEKYMAANIKTLDTNKTEEKSAQAIMLDKDVNDCFDFFSHERKKIEFIFTTAKKLRDFSKLSSFTNLAVQLYVISFFLAKKGIILLSSNNESLKSQNNCFKLKGFEAFIQHDLGKKSIKDHESDFSVYKIYVDHLFKLSTTDNLDPIDMDAITQMFTSMEVDLVDLDTRLCEKLALFWKNCGKDPNLTDKSLKRKCQDITLFIGLSIRCQKMFPFMKNNKKFDWLGFYSSLSSLSNMEIGNRIQELKIFDKASYQK